MKDITLYLEDGTYDGNLTMRSVDSKFRAYRVSKDKFHEFDTQLIGKGIYFLLMGNNAVYVGMTDKRKLNNRILDTHTGTIDRDWHTVVAFKCENNSITDEQLLYLENAMCEYVVKEMKYVIKNIKPVESNCNEKYRKSHYNLEIEQIRECKRYIDEIKYFIGHFQNSIFPQMSDSIYPMNNDNESKKKNEVLFYFRSPKRDSDGKAKILTHCGHKKARQTILLKGSKISKEVSENFDSYPSIIAKRQELEDNGKIIDRVLEEDILFNSQSGAGQFLNGRSFDGNTNWKTVKGNKPLKELL